MTIRPTRPPKTPPPAQPLIPTTAGIPVVAIVGGGSTGGGIPVPRFIPPGGFAGLAQQTQAVQSIYQRSARRARRIAPKRRKANGAPKRKVKANGARKAKPMRLVKGSAAAKRHMAKIRRKRK